MELPHIDCNMVEKHLKDLKVSKTPGPDGICKGVRCPPIF